MASVHQSPLPLDPPDHVAPLASRLIDAAAAFEGHTRTLAQSLADRDRKLATAQSVNNRALSMVKAIGRVHRGHYSHRMASQMIRFAVAELTAAGATSSNRAVDHVLYLVTTKAG
jgi:hypothetical protein